MIQASKDHGELFWLEEEFLRILLMEGIVSWISHGDGDRGRSLINSVEKDDLDDVRANETAESVDAPSLDSASVHSTHDLSPDVDISASKEIKDAKFISKQIQVDNTIAGNVKESSRDTELVKQSGINEYDAEASASKLDQLPRAVPLGLDEFKSRVSISRDKSLAGQVTGVIHRMEYNYAAASKGAKVLSSTKEAVTILLIVLLFTNLHETQLPCMVIEPLFTSYV